MLSSIRALLLFSSLSLTASCVTPETSCSSLWAEQPTGNQTDPALEQDFCTIDRHIVALSEQVDGRVWKEGLQDLMETYDFLDLSMIERRLRRLGTQAHLLAVPSFLLPDGFMVRSFQNKPIPEGYYLMVIFGESEAQDRKRSAWSAGSREENLENLKKAGVLTPVNAPDEFTSRVLP